MSSFTIAQAKPVSAPIEISIIPSLLGYIEPCGCTIDVMLGGIDRLSGLLSASNPLSKVGLRIVSGHTFFDPDAPHHRKVQDALKAELIIRGLKTAAFDYAVPPIALPPLTKAIEAASHQADLRSIHGATIVKQGQYLIGVLPIRSTTELNVHRISPPALFEDVDYVIVFSFLDRLSTRRLVRDTAWIDVAVLHEDARERSSLDPIGSGFLMEAGDRGRYVAKITIHEPDLGRPLQYTAPRPSLPKNPLFKTPISTAKVLIARPNKARLQFELIPLDDQIPANPAMSKSIVRYTQQLRSLYADRTRTGSPIDQPKSPYTGLNACGDCHPDAVKFWSTTKHAQAWQTLETLNKTFDAECVECHVTGWQQPGGSSIGFVAQLENVQCEVCHGPGRPHVESGGDPALLTHQYGAAQCKACHNKHHSPRFAYPEYRLHILGTGHGTP